ncbi:MAG TPA: hypothetical protein VN887_10465 [Candidatus Angelobacter sp.]|nr:hypothetical protein [Candidatus Angelobacter sp.]
MKNILPDSREGRWRLVLLPFEVYIVTAMFAAGFVMSGNFDDLDYKAARSLGADRAGLCLGLFNG